MYLGKVRCVVCGRELGEGYICGSCAVERYEVVVIEPFEITVCSRCGSIRMGQKWKYVEFNRAIEEAVFRNSRVMDGFEVETLRIDLASNLVTFEGRLFGDEVSVTAQMNYKVRKISCPKCSRESGGYYESILQLRADGRKLKEYEISTAKRIVEEVLKSQAENEKAFLSKVEERKEGIDFYFGSRDIGRKVSRRIAKELGGKIAESKKLHTRIDGRDVYRFTYLVRLPSYEEGDIVEKDGILCIVKNRRAGKGIDIKSGRSVSVENARVVAKKSEMRSGVVINIDESVAEIMCDDGRVFATEKPFAVEVGSEVLVFEFDGKLQAVAKDL